MIRLNVGSGQRPFAKPFINVDVNPKWSPDVVADGASMPMFDDNSADVIVLHHVLEHFGLGEADAMLKECYRILAPGGSLIVCVPDLKALARAWLKGEISDYIYMVNLYGAYMDDEADRHKFGYSYDSLYATLGSMFKVKRFDWREIPGSDIARDWWVLSLEGIK